MRQLLLVSMSFFIFVSYGCSSFDYLKSRMGLGAEEKAQSPTLEQEIELIEKAEGALKSENYQEARELFGQFQDKYIASDYYLQAQLGLGHSYYGLKEFDQAETEYKKVAAQSKVNPKLSALALYHLGLVHEQKENSQKALARFLDAKKNQENLREALKRAELPGRIASAYMRIGNKKAAYEYLKMAERGLLRLQNSEEYKTQSREWRAEVLYRMGVLPQSPITAENFHDILRALLVTQSYLVAAAEENVQPWSARSVEELKQQYQRLWSFILKLPLPKASDPAIALQLQKKKQVDLLNPYLMLVESLDQQQIFVPEGDSTPLAELAEYTESLRKEAWQLLQSLPAQTLLSAEAQELQSIRKDLKMYRVSGFRPEETQAPKSEKPPVPEASDPNL